MSSRANDALVEYEDKTLNIEVPEVRPRSEFSARNAIDRLTTIVDEESDVVVDLMHDPLENEARRKRARIRLLGRIDPEASLSLGCANVLLTMIERRRDVGNLRGEEYLRIMIESIGMFSVDRTMVLTQETMHSLQIFGDASGTALQPKSKAKASSLFELMNLCRTMPGKALLRQWFHTPTTNLSLLRSRHDAVECFLRPFNTEYAHKICQILRKCTDMRRSMHRLQVGQYGSSTGGEWQAVLQFAFHAIKVSEALHGMHETAAIDIIDRVTRTLEIPRLQKVGALINDVIDFDESGVEERIVVKRLVDEQLDEHKDVYEGLEHVLYKSCTGIARSIPSEFSELVQCVYLPQLGFLTVLPALAADKQDDPERILPIWQDVNWEVLFCTETSVYFKSAEMSEL